MRHSSHPFSPYLRFLGRDDDDNEAGWYAPPLPPSADEDDDPTPSSYDTPYSAKSDKGSVSGTGSGSVPSGSSKSFKAPGSGSGAGSGPSGSSKSFKVSASGSGSSKANKGCASGSGSGSGSSKSDKGPRGSIVTSVTSDLDFSDSKTLSSGGDARNVQRIAVSAAVAAGGAMLWL